MASAVGRAARVRLRAARVRDHRSAGRHRRAARPERRQPEDPPWPEDRGCWRGHGRPRSGWH